MEKSGKFFRVIFCRLESWDFLGLCGTNPHPPHLTTVIYLPNCIYKMSAASFKAQHSQSLDKAQPL